MGRRSTFRLLVAALAVAAGALLPASAAAHPLGNFTINHYAGLRIATDHVDLDVVIDMAEIPAFQERQTMDTNSDGSVSDAEGASWAAAACTSLMSKLALGRDAGPVALVSGSTSVAFPPGAGGLSTLRLECAFTAALAPAISSASILTFADASYTERIGWREIVATGNGTILDTGGLPPTSPSSKLTAYPADLIATPLDIRSASIGVRPDPAGPGSAGPSIAPGAAGPGASTVVVGAVPGGVAADLPSIFDTADLTPLVLLGALATAVVIGALHALTPGHGKTLMAAYLVGSRGTAIHAVGLGLSVAVSHTLGIFALALVIVGAGSVLPPDVVYRVTPVIAGFSIIAIGGWMLFGEVRRRRLARSIGEPADRLHAGEQEHDEGTHDHPHKRGHEHPPAHGHEHAAARVDAATLDHDEGPEHGHERHPDPDSPSGMHSHGGIRHSHLPPAGATLSWRGLFVLGLAGGLIPSTSALLILLGSINAGRPAFGLVLVIAFGLGMAAVMTGVGLGMIFARTRLDRVPRRSSLGRLAGVAPLIASLAVLTLGLVLTWQAVSGRPVL